MSDWDDDDPGDPDQDDDAAPTRWDVWDGRRWVQVTAPRPRRIPCACSGLFEWRPYCVTRYCRRCDDGWHSN